MIFLILLQTYKKNGEKKSGSPIVYLYDSALDTNFKKTGYVN